MLAVASGLEEGGGMVSASNALKKLSRHFRIPC